jgi:hypothetical protein
MWCRVIRMLSVAVLCLLPSELIQGFEATPATRTYVWIGELAAADPGAKTIIVKALIPEHVAKSVNRFKPGDRVMLVWDMIPRMEAATKKSEPEASPRPSSQAPTDKPSDVAKTAVPDGSKASSSRDTQPATPPAPIVLKTESDTLLYIDSYEAMKTSKVDTGYILPAEFVSADAKMVTVKLRVPDSVLTAVTSIQPGKSIRVTSPMSQPTEVAAISAVAVVK